MSSTLASAPVKLAAATSAEVIAVAFASNGTGGFSFQGPGTIISDIESCFDINLIDELSFFSPSGKAGEIFEIPVSAQNCVTERIYLTAIGDGSTPSFRIAATAIARKVRGKKMTVYSACAVKNPDIAAHSTSLTMGAYLWSLKSGKPAEVPNFLVASDDKEIVNGASILAKAITRARDLVHTPSNIKTPEWMATQAQAFAQTNGLTVNVLKGKELKEFGGLRAVGNSSPKPGPRFIEVSYAPKNKKSSHGALPHVVLVGKGITFDTGGIVLKRPYDLMIPMKSDMAGAAAILATLTALEELQPNVRVTALMMCAENAISSTAQRPSDVIKQYGGTTVEVIDTDAEGRLVLADGLAYADINLDPDYLIDIATLTGAATVGLGRQYAAMYTRDDKLAAEFEKAGADSGDRVWRMPLIDDYQGALRSDIADFNHVSHGEDFSAKSVVAALFLEHFAGNRRWLHLDIAGTGRSDVDAGENPKGGTGYGVRLLTQWIVSLK
ncbi:MAG: leucyl aminopeptidase family protein [Streptomycetaceae bacterium]|nr:MAG: leucyl aminopeptidase family protein [Streptomycetaceae bacterium]